MAATLGLLRGAPQGRAGARTGRELMVTLVEALGGQAGTVIIQRVERWPADLIVSGSRGRRGVRLPLMRRDADAS